jgi:hypothetical protein
MIVSFIYWLSLSALFLTKAADVITTIKYVGAQGESNPLALFFFDRFGFHMGLLMVCALFTVLAMGQYVLVWRTCGTYGRLANALLGFFVAWVQFDVARFNSTGRHSRITLFALKTYNRWRRKWKI